MNKTSYEQFLKETGIIQCNIEYYIEWLENRNKWLENKLERLLK